ncbi:MAG TPA: protease HtpX [Polyangiaceae bacterium]|nr:protease HtpX [Polyangiaceae bacterium]
MFKRIALLVLTNLAVMAAITVVINVLNALGVFGHSDFLRNYGPLVVMSGIVGFGGSFISLLASKWIAKWTTGAQVITQPRTSDEAWLLQTVQRLAERAGVATPEVAIYDSPELNAFATGATRNSSLVAVSSGLLTRMNRSEVEAVVGHELSHVANGDMVTLTLLQGVLNTFVFFFSHVLGRLIDGALRGDRDEERRGVGIGQYLATMVAQLVLGFLAALIINAFSRWREFRADRGGANLAGRAKMIGALRRLGAEEQTALPESLAAFGINGGGLIGLLRSHPPIEQRIQALQAESYGASLNASV